MVIALGILAAPAPAAPKAPTPSESLDAYTARWKAAVETADCPQLAAIYGFDAGTEQQHCTFFADKLRGLEVIGTQRFGTGAIIRYRSATLPLGESILVSSNAEQGRWIDVTNTAGAVGFRSNTLGTKSAHGPAFKRAAAVYLRALRTRNCSALRNIESSAGMSRSEQCRSAFTSPLAKLLTKRTKAVRLGGNKTFAFYGVAIGRRFFTVPMFFDTDGEVDVVQHFRTR